MFKRVEMPEWQTIITIVAFLITFSLFVFFVVLLLVIVAVGKLVRWLSHRRQIDNGGKSILGESVLHTEQTHQHAEPKILKLHYLSP